MFTFYPSIKYCIFVYIHIYHFVGTTCCLIMTYVTTTTTTTTTTTHFVHIFVTCSTADRAKSIKTRATINESPTDKLIRELREENSRLLEMLNGMKTGVAGELGQPHGVSEEGLSPCRSGATSIICVYVHLNHTFECVFYFKSVTNAFLKHKHLLLNIYERTYFYFFLFSKKFLG